MMNILTATGSVFAREARAKLRTPWPYAESLADPLALLVLFGALITSLGAMPGMPGGDSIQWFAPGILVLMVFTTSAFIGAGLQEERQSGALERMLVTPVGHFAQLFGRVLRVVVTVLIQSVIVIGVSIPFGLRISAAALPVALVLLLALAAALGLASLAIGLVLSNAYAFWGVVSLVYTPIIVTSGVLLPMDLAPDWLFAVSRLNPLAYVVEAQRDLFAGGITEPSVWLAYAIIVGFAAVSIVLGTRGLRRLRA